MASEPWFSSDDPLEAVVAGALADRSTAWRRSKGLMADRRRWAVGSSFARFGSGALRVGV